MREEIFEVEWPIENYRLPLLIQNEWQIKSEDELNQPIGDAEPVHLYQVDFDIREDIFTEKLPKYMFNPK